MAKGKQTCKILKEIRKQIAEDNDINLVIEECTYQGDCQGTCPRCEAEVRYLERELEKRQRIGKVAVFAGMSLGTIFAASSCDATKPVPGKEPLAGDVVAVAPEPPKEVKDTIPELVGIVRMLQITYPFDDVIYEQSLKKLLGKMHICYLLKEEDRRIPTTKGRSLDFQEIIDTIYKPAGISLVY